MGDKTLFDKLLEWLTADRGRRTELVLSDDEKNCLARYSFIDDQYRRHRPALGTKAIVNMVVSRFEVSERQAYYDIKQAQRLFGTLNKTDKDYMISVQVEWYRQLRSLAEADGDYMAAVAASRQIDALLGLHEKDVEGAQLQPTTLQVLVLSGDTQEPINIDHLQKISEKDFNTLTEASDADVPTTNDILKIMDKEGMDGNEQ